MSRGTDAYTRVIIIRGVAACASLEISVCAASAKVKFSYTSHGVVYPMHTFAIHIHAHMQRRQSIQPERRSHMLLPYMRMRSAAVIAAARNMLVRPRIGAHTLAPHTHSASTNSAGILSARLKRRDTRDAHAGRRDHGARRGQSMSFYRA